MVDVVTAGWMGARGPLPPDLSETGSCARCGQPGRLTRKAAVVSKNFTAFDRWSQASGRGLCPACTWGYRTEGLRQHPHLIAHAPAKLRCLTVLELGQVLTRPLDRQSALVVPLRRGRRHLVPDASWGQVTVDGTSLPWTRADVGRLEVMRELRNLGFGSRSFSDPAPPIAVLRRLPSKAWPDVILKWAELQPWRQRDLWLRLGLAATDDTVAAAA